MWLEWSGSRCQDTVYSETQSTLPPGNQENELLEYYSDDRMESNGEALKIHMSGATADLLRDNFDTFQGRSV